MNLPPTPILFPGIEMDSSALRAADEYNKRERNDALKEQSRPLEQLVIGVYGSIITPVEQDIYKNTISPHSEMIMGGRSSKYSAGQSTKTKFTMNNFENGQIKGKLDIIFEGHTALELRDIINLYLFLGENKNYDEFERIVPLSSGDLPVLIDGAEKVIPSVWIPRKMRETERALRITKYLHAEQKAIYTDISYAQELGIDISKLPD